MSEEIIDVDSTSSEKQLENGLVIPDSSTVEDIDEETLKKIEERREEIKNLIPEYPKEWQQGIEEDVNGFEETDNPSVKVSLKEKEVNKLIKKYKRYMKSNLKEIRRVDY